MAEFGLVARLRLVALCLAAAERRLALPLLGLEPLGKRGSLGKFRGSIGYAYQPFGWNDNNVANCTEFKTPFGASRVAVSCDPASSSTPLAP